MGDQDMLPNDRQSLQPEAQADQPKPSFRLRLRKRARIITWVVSAVLAFALGLGSGYAVWGRQPAMLHSDTMETSTPVATEPHEDEIDLAALSRQVNPPEGYTLPARFGDVGPQLIAAGAIDLDRFAQVYTESGRPLTEAQLMILTNGSNESIVIDSDNAYFLLNFFWAFGLTNQNRILTEGPMMQGGVDQIGRFASTAGWTIGAKSPVELYASAPLVTLSPDQQLRAEEVARQVFRPCCDNPTHFPDCNHGMAMLGLLELMAAQGATSGDMLKAAKYINAFWYPQQALEQAVYLKMARGLDFAQAEPRQVVAASFSSASGFQVVHQRLAESGVLKQRPEGGSSCGVQ